MQSVTQILKKEIQMQKAECYKHYKKQIRRQEMKETDQTKIECWEDESMETKISCEQPCLS